jgi:hypothetical protein
MSSASQNLTLMKELNRAAHHFQRFDTLYFQCLVRVDHMSAPLSQGLLRDIPSRRRAPQIDSETSELCRLAHDVSQFGFVYPEVFTREAFPGHSSGVSDTPALTSNTTENLSTLKELNRMARLVELSSDRMELYPVYKTSYDFADPYFSKSIAYATGLLKGDFATAFPKTAFPSVSYFSGQPRISRDIFNALLSSKLSQVRSILKTKVTPKGAPAYIASMINRSIAKTLSSQTSSRRRNQAPTNTRAPATQPRSNVAFVTAAPEPQQSVPPTEPQPETPTVLEPSIAPEPQAPVPAPATPSNLYSSSDARDLATAINRLVIRSAPHEIMPPIPGCLRLLTAPYSHRSIRTEMVRDPSTRRRTEQEIVSFALAPEPAQVLDMFALFCEAFDITIPQNSANSFFAPIYVLQHLPHEAVEFTLPSFDPILRYLSTITQF